MFDQDAKLILFTNVPSKSRSSDGSGLPSSKNTQIVMDFSEETIDLYALHQFIADQLLGNDTVRVKSVKSSDTDTDLKLYCNSYWIDGGVSSVIELCNCIASSITIHNCVSHHIIGLAD